MGVGAAAAGTAAAAGAATAGTAVAATGVTAASVLSNVGAVGAGLAGVTGAIGAINSASAQKENAEYQAQVAANNQQIAKNDAGQAEAAGEAATEQAGLKARAQVGAIKAAQAASNIDVNSGSAVDVRSSAAELDQLSQLQIRGNAQRQAYGYQTQAAGFGSQEVLDKSLAAQAPTAGAISAAGSLLSGATGVANQYSKWKSVAGSSSPGGGLAMFS
jgi:hypothetical protein